MSSSICSLDKQRWYLDAAWQRKRVPTVPLEAPRAGELVGVDITADYLAAWRLTPHGNPIGAPRTFGSDLSGGANRRDAQAESHAQQRETTRHARPGPRTRSARPPGAKNAERQAAQHRSRPATEQHSVSLSVWERLFTDALDRSASLATLDQIRCLGLPRGRHRAARRVHRPQVLNE